MCFFFFSSRRRHTRFDCDWSSDVCSSDLVRLTSDILFDHNSAALRSTSRATLNELAQNFAQYPDNVIIVEGHTDSTGTDQRSEERRVGKECRSRRSSYQ